MILRTLTALPVYNEASHIQAVLSEVGKHCQDILVVDDGSTDGTIDRLGNLSDIQVVRHQHNLGYGAALSTAFHYAVEHKFDVLVTIDCDGQHEPRLIPGLSRHLAPAGGDMFDMVSGSRYLETQAPDSHPPADRKRINFAITQLVNERLQWNLTDAFCGFKAYRVESLRSLQITETGYAMPLQLWVQAKRLAWKIIEFPVPLVYLDQSRSFGGSLDDADRRMAYYHDVFEREWEANNMRCGRDSV
ncbi:MAG: glycosyltransferase family 2 protein [Planctomycetaceae bacterium]